MRRNCNQMTREFHIFSGQSFFRLRGLCDLLFKTQFQQKTAKIAKPIQAVFIQVTSYCGAFSTQNFLSTTRFQAFADQEPLS